METQPKMWMSWEWRQNLKGFFAPKVDSTYFAIHEDIDFWTLLLLLLFWSRRASVPLSRSDLTHCSSTIWWSQIQQQAVAHPLLSPCAWPMISIIGGIQRNLLNSPGSQSAGVTNLWGVIFGWYLAFKPGYRVPNGARLKLFDKKMLISRLCFIAIPEFCEIAI